MTARVHGMTQNEVPPDWPPLTEAELAPVIAAYPALGGLREIAWHSRRPFAASGIVTCAHESVFIKRHDARVRDAADLRQEHDFIAHLRAHGAKVPGVLRNQSGDTVTGSALGCVEIHEMGQGQDAYRDAHSWTPIRNTADAHEAGAALARLHVAASGFTAPARATRLVVAGDAIAASADPTIALEAWVAGDARLRTALHPRPFREDFHRVLHPFYEALRPFRAEFPPCWVHGDFHASNLLWQEGAVSCVLDFGLSNRASALYDLATAIERNAIAWLALSPKHTAIGHADLAGALIAGYDLILPVSARQIAALRALLPVVHVEFALSELAYFHAITRSPRDADLAYDTFLLGHATWFASGDGGRFVTGL
jgi:Ser/Thr protein kinase RdoA (MazF antagonist)